MAAVEKILLQFEADIQDLKSELGDVKKQLGNVEKQTEQTGSKITNTFKNVGKAIAGAFAIREVVQFGLEAEKLARQAEGVKKAFDNIATAGTLEKLRAATKGTVSDLQLMQNAVKASNFQIPLDQLGKLFAFAQQRARETGESVDYLVDSIVLGIGRKSPLILDNLGISAVRLRSEFKGLGVETAEVGDVAAAVGRIIDEEMTKAGDTTTEAADAADRAKANFENLKVAIGQQLLPALTALRTGFADSLEWIGRNFGLIREEISLTTEEQIKQLDVSVKEVDGLKSLVDRYDELSKEVNLTSEQKSEMSRITTQLTSEFGSSAIAINSETGAYELNREAILKQIQTRALLNSNEAQALLMKRAQLQLEIDRGKAVYGINEALLANNQLQGQALVDFQVSQAAYKAAKDELALLDEQLRNIGLDLESLVIPALNNTSGALGTTTKKAENLWRTFFRVKTEQETLAIETAVLKEVFDGFQFTIDNTTQGIKGMSEAWKENYEQNKKNSDVIDNSILYAMQLSDAMGMLQGSISDIAGEQGKFTNFLQSLSIAQILFSRSVAIANAVEAGSLSLKQPGGLLKFLATTTFIISQITGFIGDSLKTVRSQQVPAYADGVVDLKGAGTERSDSIVARLSKGESVITAKGTRQDKGLFEAANKLELEKYINANYILPALKEKQKSEGAMFDDYRLYLTMIKGQNQDKELNKKLVKVLGQRVNKNNNWA